MLIIEQITKILVKIFWWIIVITILFKIAPTVRVYAHPIDNTDTYIYIGNEIDNSFIEKNEIITYVYLNWFQAGAIVEKEKNFVAPDIYKLLEYQELFDNYVLDNLLISNNGNICNAQLVNIQNSTDEFSLSLGTRTIVKFRCPENIDDLVIENNLMLDYFDSPTNYTHIYNGENLLHKFTLKKDNNIYSFNYWKLQNSPIGDEAYDINKDSTYDEVVNSMNDYSPIPQDLEISESSLSTGDNNPKAEVNQSLISVWYDKIYNKFIELKDENIIIILFLALFLGFLHTMEVGHSKAIIASIMIDKKVSIRNGMAYSLVFTITHIADIILLGIIFLTADKYFNVFSNFTKIETIASYLLLIISSYLLYKSIKQYEKSKIKTSISNLRNELSSSHNNSHNHKHVHNHQHTHEFEHGHLHDHVHPHTHDYYNSKPFREQLILGFITGLAPCLFGWSIFMLILSTGDLLLLIPVILFFGMGIFLALSIVVIIIGKIKAKAYVNADKFALLSPIISALILVLYSILNII